MKIEVILSNGEKQLLDVELIVIKKDEAEFKICGLNATSSNMIEVCVSEDKNIQIVPIDTNTIHIY